jgi:hypothetical protein
LATFGASVVKYVECIVGGGEVASTDDLLNAIMRDFRYRYLPPAFFRSITELWSDPSNFDACSQKERFLLTTFLAVGRTLESERGCGKVSESVPMGMEGASKSANIDTQISHDFVEQHSVSTAAKILGDLHASSKFQILLPSLGVHMLNIAPASALTWCGRGADKVANNVAVKEQRSNARLSPAEEVAKRLIESGARSEEKTLDENYGFTP